MSKIGKGRPTKFKKRYIKDLIDFFDGEVMRKELMEVVDEFDKDGNIKKSAKKYKYMPNKLPTIYGFAKKIGVDYTTVYRWAESGQDEVSFEDKLKKQLITPKDVHIAKEISDFSKAYRTAKAAQQEFLMEVGLTGVTPPAAYIFTAKNITGMRDKVEQDVTIKQVKPLLDNLSLANVYNNDSDEEGSEPKKAN